MSLNPLCIPVLILPGPMPPGTVISAAALDERSDIAALRERALHSAEQEIEQLRHQARDGAVAEAVQWLCREHEMERIIAGQLATRWRGLTASVLKKLLSNSDQNEPMLRRVECEVAQLLPQGRLTLYVEPAALDTATRAYAATPELAIVADAELGPGQARLDNGLVRISLDERAYRDGLLEQLSGEVEGVAHA
ncbi:MAG: hypothetical protein JHC61_05295 [Burkholderiaceae bacterium]|nr:hypothetical protein [Burkholderiaceae bacterium]